MLQLTKPKVTMTLNAYLPQLPLIEDPKRRLAYLSGALEELEAHGVEGVKANAHFHYLLLTEVERLERTFVN